jgi:hypothetical protein
MRFLLKTAQNQDKAIYFQCIYVVIIVLRVPYCCKCRLGRAGTKFTSQRAFSRLLSAIGAVQIRLMNFYCIISYQKVCQIYSSFISQRDLERVPILRIRFHN